MKLLHLTFLAALAALSLAVSACGGGGDVPAGAIAVVDGTEIREDELDTLLVQAKRQYGARVSAGRDARIPERQEAVRRSPRAG